MSNYIIILTVYKCFSGFLWPLLINARSTKDTNIGNNCIGDISVRSIYIKHTYIKNTYFRNTYIIGIGTIERLKIYL